MAELTIYLLSTLYLYFFGRGILIIKNFKFEKNIINDKEKVFGIKINTFYPIIGLFVIGNFSVVYNFFLPININFVKYISFILIFNFFNKHEFKLFYQFILKVLVFSVPLTIGFHNLGLHYDAGLYHLNYQNFLREEKIILGLTNLYDHYGFSSIIEYLHALLWIDNNLILLKTIQFNFFLVLLLFINENLFFSEEINNKKLAFLSIVYMFLDNFGIGGGLNGSPQIQGLTKFDSIFSILFFITIFLYLHLANKQRTKIIEFKILLIFMIFTLETRPSGILLFFLFLIILLKSKEPIKIILRNKVLIIINLIWLFKNLLLSGCLLYPLSLSCFEIFQWSNSQIAKNLSANLQTYFLTSNFEINYSKTLLTNSLISIFILIFLQIFIFGSFKIIFKNKLEIYFFIILNIALFLYFLPSARFFSGFLFSLVLLTGNIIRNDFFKINKIISLIIFALSIFSIPTINQYLTYLQNPSSSLEIEITKTNYKNVNNFLVPEIGDQCWVNPKCIPYKTYTTKKNIYKYYMFVK